jgi:hypothetical protein
MHAILALSASHLEALTGAPLSSTAMHHRILAIKGSNEAMSQVNRTGSDGDALLAACYLLTFQSIQMKEGIAEFFLFVRGCSLVSRQLKSEKLSMAFFLTEGDHWSFMEERLKNLPTISPEILDGAEQSLSALPTLLKEPVHLKFFHALVRCIHGVKSSSLNGVS